MAKHLGLSNPALTGSSVSLDRRSNTSLNVINNAMYFDVDSGNPYNTLQRNNIHDVNPGPQRKRIAEYDDVSPRVVGQSNSRTSQTSKIPGRGRQRRNGGIFRVVLICLIVVVAIIALLLALLLMMGKLGPKCRCRNSYSGASPKAGKQSSGEQKQQNNTRTSQTTFNMDLSPFYDILEDLQANISSLRKASESLEKESEGNKDSLLAAKTEFNSTREAITLFYNRFYAVINHVNNSLKQFSHDNGPVFGRLQSLNTTFSSMLAEMNQTYQQYNDVIGDAIQNLNHTIAQKVANKTTEPGPVGQRGENGFKGPRGDEGPTGPQGDVGIKGPPGAQGDKGSPGDPGFPGKNGGKGMTGEKGSKGPQGDTGADGAQGDTGDQGPRGIGNFSWCQYTIKEVTANSVSADDTQSHKVFGAYCTTADNDAESNLEASPPPPNSNSYTCLCRKLSQIPRCALHYWACPIQAP